MVEPTITFKNHHPKVKRYTRKQRHARLLIEAREERAATKREQRQGQNRARRTAKKYGVFEGCSPERTLALLGEDG